MILNDLIDDYSNDYNEPRQLDIDFQSPVSININKGDNYFDVLDELAQQTDAIWDIKDKTIIFRQNFGTDRTQGDQYQEITYN